MDISFKTENGRFNLRVAAVIMNEGKLLAMTDERSPYFYLPGGKIALGETAERAVLRELTEELSIEARVIRPLYIAQSFFTEETSNEEFHEICFNFLVDIENTSLLSRGERFTIRERHHILEFSWINLSELEDMYFYPLFLKKRIRMLPESLDIITEHE